MAQELRLRQYQSVEKVGLELRRVALIALLALASTLLFSRPAQADDTDDRARKLYLEGEDAYAAGRYKSASKKFEEAFKLSKRPALLFNLGNTYERMGDYEKAAQALQRYLDLPNPQRVEETEQRIRGLRKKADAERRRQEELRKLRARERKGEKGKSGPSRMPSYLLIGGGGAAIVAGVLFGLGASSAGSDAEGKCETGPSGGLFCPTDAKSSLDRERNLSIAADLSFVVGVGAIVTGVILWVMDDKPNEKPIVDEDGYVDDDEESTTMRFGPTLLPGGGGGLGVVGRF